MTSNHAFPATSPFVADGADQYDLIRISGPDRVRFLQGQLSCNVEQLRQGRSLRGCLCNLKGRVITDLRLLSAGDDLLMLTPRGMAEALLSTLARYQVFYKTTLQQIDTPLLLLAGRLGELPSAALQLDQTTEADQVTVTPAATVITIDQNDQDIQRFILIENPQQPSALRAQLLSDCAAMPAEYWSRRNIEAGIAHIKPDTQEQFTPQLLNYDINGSIDFKKGCYTGQEVVARMYYRAEAKRRLGKVWVPSLDELSALGVNPQQDLVDHAADGDGYLCLVVCSVQADQRHADIQLLS